MNRQLVVNPSRASFIGPISSLSLFSSPSLLLISSYNDETLTGFPNLSCSYLNFKATLSVLLDISLDPSPPSDRLNVMPSIVSSSVSIIPVSYTHLRAHETD